VLLLSRIAKRLQQMEFTFGAKLDQSMTAAWAKGGWKIEGGPFT
jgi:hypothetical protein